LIVIGSGGEVSIGSGGEEKGHIWFLSF
jgi:hypothetical protein